MRFEASSARSRTAQEAHYHYARQSPAVAADTLPFPAATVANRLRVGSAGGSLSCRFAGRNRDAWLAHRTEYSTAQTGLSYAYLGKITHARGTQPVPLFFLLPVFFIKEESAVHCAYIYIARLGSRIRWIPIALFLLKPSLLRPSRPSCGNGSWFVG